MITFSLRTTNVVLSCESVIYIRWPQYWSFSFNINPSNEYSRLISFRMNWLGILAVQGILKSLLQHHSSKASILWHSAFFIVQLSHPYMTTAKTIALTRQTFVGKIMSLLFNMLSSLPHYQILHQSSIFVITDKHTFIHHHHQKSRIGIKVLVLHILWFWTNV